MHILPNGFLNFHLSIFIHFLCPLHSALCPMPYALCAMPINLSIFVVISIENGEEKESNAGLAGLDKACMVAGAFNGHTGLSPGL